MASITITGKVVNANGLPKFVPDNTLAFQLAFAKFVGQSVSVTVDNAKRKRSIKQNDYYHGVIVKYTTMHLNEQNKTTYTTDEVHNFFLMTFCPEKEYEVNDLLTGEIMYDTKKSTTLLSTAEAEEYYEQCRAWAATNLGLTIPLPNE